MTEQGILFMMLLVAAHVATVYWITKAQEKTIEECRKVILEREETERQYYAVSVTDSGTDSANLEVV